MKSVDLLFELKVEEKIERSCAIIFEILVRSMKMKLTSTKKFQSNDNF